MEIRGTDIRGKNEGKCPVTKFIIRSSGFHLHSTTYNAHEEWVNQVTDKNLIFMTGEARTHMLAFL